MPNRQFTTILCLSFVFSTENLAAQDGVLDATGPLSPKAAELAFQLHAGCQIELVASEPDVIDPVHIAFSSDGKLWVVEMSDYPNGPQNSQPGLSRIRVLSDDDGDGRYTNPVTFAEKLLFANGLMFWRDGVIVTTDGKIQFMRDTNNDGTADETQIWFQGFATENPQLRHNHPQLGIDCWIYIANGLRGGNIVPGAGNPWGLDPHAKPLSISGRDFRFDPVTGEYEAIAGQGQFGMTFDERGNRFVCTNRNPCRQIVLENELLAQTPGLRASRHYEDVAPAGENSQLFPISRTWTTSNLHANQFTAACGVLIFRDDLGAIAGDEDAILAFTCDPTANLVHLEKLTRVGPTFARRNEHPIQGATNAGTQREFLATKDEWFRPVNLTHGPDRSLYVVDMYRAVIEHPQFMPVELKDRPDLTLGEDKGRIWRIRFDTTSDTPRPRSQRFEMFYPGDAAGLLQNLNDHQSSIWMKEHSRRGLLEIPTDDTVETLKDALRDDRSDSRFVMHLLDRGDQLTIADMVTISDVAMESGMYSLWDYPAPFWRIGQIRFGGETEWQVLVNKIVSAGHCDPYGVLAHLPWRDLNDANQSTLLTNVLRPIQQIRQESSRSTTQRHWVSVFLQLSARGDVLDLCSKILKQNEVSPQKSGQLESNDHVISSVQYDLAGLVARQNQPEQIGKLLELTFEKERFDEGIQLGVLAGIANGIPGGRNRLMNEIEQLSASSRNRIQKFIRNAVIRVENSKFESLELAIIGLADDPQSFNFLVESITSGNTGRASLALSSLLKLSADRVNAALPKILSKCRGSIRRSVLQAMAASPARAKILLDEIESGRVAALEIDATLERVLLRHKEPKLIIRIRKLLKRSPPADRIQVLSDYQASLSMESDPLRGRVVFEKNCATCHRIGELGVNVAPDISDSRTKTPEYLLTNILDPNRAIDANYFSYTIADTQGLVYTGVVDAETGSSITLKQPEGKRVTIPRDEIEVIKNNGISLMPVGLERTINQQQMADLISFIKNWRYLDGLVPQDVIR